MFHHISSFPTVFDDHYATTIFSVAIMYDVLCFKHLENTISYISPPFSLMIPILPQSFSYGQPLTPTLPALTIIFYAHSVIDCARKWVLRRRTCNHGKRGNAQQRTSWRLRTSDRHRGRISGSRVHAALKVFPHGLRLPVARS